MKNSTGDLHDGGDHEDNQMEGNDEVFDNCITHKNSYLKLTIEEAISEMSKGDFAYKEVSDVSDVTEESYPEGL